MRSTEVRTVIGEGRELLAGLAVAAIAFLVYANSLGNGFVWDDDLVIVNNSVLHGDARSLFSAIDSGRDTDISPYYRPLTFLSFWAELRLHGLTPFFVRIFNVLLHAANAFLVYRLARSLLAVPAAALLAGLLFAVHPLQAEAVDFNAGGRNTMLAGFFVLAAFLIHRRSVERNSLAVAFAGAALFSAGLFSKESALVILPFIAVLELPSLRSDSASEKLRGAVRVLPYLVGMGAYLVMRWQVLAEAGAQTSIIPGLGIERLERMYVIPDIGTRLSENLYIIPRYVLNILWPDALSPRYLVPGDLRPLALPLAFAWLCIAAALGWLLTRGRTPVTVFGLCWAIAFWLPVSGIIFVPSAPLADRYAYLPAIGLWLIMADQASRFLASGAPLRRYAAVLVGIILVALALVTVQRNKDWQSNIALFSRLVALDPDNPYGHANLGTAYLDARDLALAEQELIKALTLDPTMSELYTPLGHVRMLKDDVAGAFRYYSDALARFPLDRDARINRAIMLERLGRRQEALADYRFYLSLPDRNDIPGSRAYASERMSILSRE